MVQTRVHARRGVALLSVFGGVTFDYSPLLQVVQAFVMAQQYSLNSTVSAGTAKRW